MKIAFTGGGTGGHVYPALAVIDELQKKPISINFIWIGEKNGMEKKIVAQTHIPFYGIRAGKLRRYFSVKNFTDIFNIIVGFFQAYHILRKQKPRMLFSKGGFVSVPSVWAAALLGIPIIIHESDYSLGLANRLSIAFAKHVYVSFPNTPKEIKNKWKPKVVLTGSPVRASLEQGNRFKGRQKWLTSDSQQLILVMGGSQGAKAINDLIIGYLPHKLDNIVIVHQTGFQHDQYTHFASSSYHPQAYFSDDLPDLIAAADLVISRAGAGAINEFGVMKKTVLLLPLKGHQSTNSKWLAQKSAIEVIYPEDVTQTIFNQKIKKLLNDRAFSKSLAATLHQTIEINARTKIAQSLLLEFNNL